MGAGRETEQEIAAGRREAEGTLAGIVAEKVEVKEDAQSDRAQASSDPAKEIDAKNNFVVLTDLITIHIPENLLRKLPEKSFNFDKKYAAILAEIKNINDFLDKGKKINFAVVERGGKLILQIKKGDLPKKDLAIDSNAWQNDFITNLQQLLKQESQEALPDSEYRNYLKEVLAVPELKNSPFGGFLIAMLTLAAKYPGFAQSIFGESMVEKMKNKEFNNEKFSKEELDQIANSKIKVREEEKMKELIDRLPTSYDGVKASMWYLTEALWGGEENTFKFSNDLATLASKLKNSGIEKSSEVKEGGEKKTIDPFYKEVNQEQIFKNKTDGTIVFFNFSGVFNTGWEFLYAFNQTKKDKKENIPLLVGFINAGHLEFYNKNEAGVKRIPLDNLKSSGIKLMMAFEPAEKLHEIQENSQKDEKLLKLEEKTDRVLAEYQKGQNKIIFETKSGELQKNLDKMKKYEELESLKGEIEAEPDQTRKEALKDQLKVKFADLLTATHEQLLEENERLEKEYEEIRELYEVSLEGYLDRFKILKDELDPFGEKFPNTRKKLKAVHEKIVEIEKIIGQISDNQL